MQNWDDELRNIMARKMNDLVKRIVTIVVTVAKEIKIKW
jgi:hypothetical protein